MEKARPPSSMWFRLTCEPWAVELPDPIDVFSVSTKKVKLTKLGIFLLGSSTVKKTKKAERFILY